MSIENVETQERELKITNFGLHQKNVQDVIDRAQCDKELQRSLCGSSGEMYTGVDEANDDREDVGGRLCECEICNDAKKS